MSATTEMNPAVRARNAGLRAGVAAVLAVGLTVASGMGATPAARAAEKSGSELTVTLDAPAEATQLWVELELPGLDASDASLRYRASGDPSGWTAVEMSSTAFGLTGIVSAAPGKYEIAAVSSDESQPDLVVTFATDQGVIVASHRERLPSPAGAEPGDSPGGGDAAAPVPAASDLAKTGSIEPTVYGVLAAIAALLGGMLVLSGRGLAGTSPTAPVRSETTGVVR